MGEISLGRYTVRTCDADTLKEMYRLRHAVFHDRLCWDVVSDNGMEHDFFDVLNPLYVLLRGGGHELVACWRLLPTTGAYMLREVFPQLLHGQSAPQEQGIWESRSRLLIGRPPPSASVKPRSTCSRPWSVSRSKTASAVISR